MIELVTEEQCNGCMSCVQSCIKQCIAIKKSKQGYLYPAIDREQCISCGKCQLACPVINKNNLKKPYKAYAVWSLDEKSRKVSTSGGAAAEFYQTALDKGYWICGAEYTDQFRVIHTLTKDKNKILDFRQSKYVYSESRSIYKEVKNVLDQNKSVLFISLPCKVAGLLKYLGRTYENLITVDIICHGVPSYQMLDEHIHFCEGKEKASQIRFRQDNDYGFLLSNAKKIVYQKKGKTDTYLAAFLEGLNYRPSCYQCVFAGPERVGDLTIGDFWGLGMEIPFEYPYTGGISVVLINTEKGEKFFECTKKCIYSEERPVTEAIKGNSQLNHPTMMHLKRKLFDEMYERVGFEEAVKTCLYDEMKKEQKQICKVSIRLKLRKLAGLFIKKYRG